MSQRGDIREAIKAALTTPPISGIGTRVFTNRMRKVYPDEMPAVVIYTKSESAEIYIAAPREYKRTMKVAIEVFDKFDDAGETTLEDDVDDRLDALAEQIEQRLYKDETLGGKVSDLKFSDSESDFMPEGEQPIGALRMTFDVEYFVLAPIEQTGLDAFETAHVETTIQPDTGQDPAVDDIELPQI